MSDPFIRAKLLFAEMCLLDGEATARAAFDAAAKRGRGERGDRPNTGRRITLQHRFNVQAGMTISQSAKKLCDDYQAGKLAFNPGGMADEPESPSVAAVEKKIRRMMPPRATAGELAEVETLLSEPVAATGFVAVWPDAKSGI